jgi:hypothetical protein
MTGQVKPRARRREVPAEDVDADYDYADSFEIELAETDARTPEQLFRTALERAPSLPPLVPVVHRYVLRFRLGPLASPQHLFGWRVVTSEPDVIRLEADGPLMRGIIIGRRASRSTAVLTTYVYYRQRARARVIWEFIGPLHRRVAPYLLQFGAAPSCQARTSSR